MGENEDDGDGLGHEDGGVHFDHDSGNDHYSLGGSYVYARVLHGCSHIHDYDDSPQEREYDDVALLSKNVNVDLFYVGDDVLHGGYDDNCGVYGEPQLLCPYQLPSHSPEL